MVKKEGQMSEVRSRTINLYVASKLLPLGFYFLLLSCAGKSFSQEITAKASTDKTQYQVGDYINYTIVVNCGKDSKIYSASVCH